jgi:ABC-type transport system substrate-binding protein
VDGLLRDPVRPEHHRSAQDLSLSRPLRPLAAAAVLGLVAATGGCGGNSTEPVSPGSPPTPTGTLGIALARGPTTFDPLLATTAADRLVAAQVYEPLTRTISGPYGGTARKLGLVVTARPGAHRTVWRLELRPGVRFSDGARFDASAVLQNAARWRTTPDGQALLPGLLAADAPRPDLVRLIFGEPDPDLVHQLASVRLGIVSPAALRSSGASELLGGRPAAGTGPFLVQRRGAHGILLARNQRWWGTRRDLGPGVELVDLRFPLDADQRLAALRRGTVQIAEGVGGERLAALRRDPLLTAQPGPGGTAVGLQRSVRGFAAAHGTPALSRAWLTTVGSGAR